MTIVDDNAGSLPGIISNGKEAEGTPTKRRDGKDKKKKKKKAGDDNEAEGSQTKISDHLKAGM